MSDGELRVDAVDEPAFGISAQLQGSAIHVATRGNADLTWQARLAAAINQIHDEAARLAVAEVVVDLRQLEFMNSSCLKSIVGWIGKLQRLATAQQYKIRLLTKPDILWQRRSLHALRLFAVDLVSVET